MLTIEKDLRTRFVGARDQGPRPTCLAFALSDAHAAERPPHRSLSVDFLYYHALLRMPPNRGGNGMGLRQAIDALRIDGQPVETDWPYSRTLPVDLTKWKPPGKLAVMNAKGTTAPTSVDWVCARLDQGQPSVLVFRPSEQFYYADAAGLLQERSPDPDLPASHAVVAVGYGVAAAKRHVLIRNSWGTSWGQHGHAWLAEDYLALRLSSVISIQTN